MEYICIDLWNKRCWVAVSREGIAFSRDIVERVDIIKYLKKYFSEVSALHSIVVWLPHDLYWKDTLQLERTEKFIEKLQDIFPEIPVVWHDERFSSFQAHEASWEHRDDIAAQIILQSYMDSITR